MLGAHLNFCSSVSAPGSSIDQSMLINPARQPHSQCLYQFSQRSSSMNLYSVKLNPLSDTRGRWRGRFCPKAHPKGHHDAGHDYLEAVVMIVDSVKHYQLLLQGFREDSSRSRLEKELRTHNVSLRLGFLRRFKSPTIFLKIPCDGDLLLPIAVGDFALERLIDSVEEARGLCANQYEATRNITSEVGYQVTSVKITQKVESDYFARIHFSKVGIKGGFSINARPSDAINVAVRCKAPIYVNRKILMDDAIQLNFRTSRLHGAEPCIHPILDRPSKGRDLLAKELIVVKNMNMAIKEERYNDAAMWRDKLLTLHESDSES